MKKIWKQPTIDIVGIEKQGDVITFSPTDVPIDYDKIWGSGADTQNFDEGEK